MGSGECWHFPLRVNLDTVKNFLEESGFVFNEGYIDVPLAMSHLKIDVGLSENAPQSQRWIEADHDTFVFGFEPISENRKRINSGDSDWPLKLNPKYIGERIYIVPSALYSRHVPEGMEFNVTRNDPGCSSLLKPVNFEIAYLEQVQVWTLDNFLATIDPVRFPVIDHLKVDVQGSDFEVIKGIGSSFGRLLSITIEVDTSGYHGTTNHYPSIVSYMRERGFRRLRFPKLLQYLLRINNVKLEVEIDDPTFINYAKLFRMRNRNLLLFQRG